MRRGHGSSLLRMKFAGKQRVDYFEIPSHAKISYSYSLKRSNDIKDSGNVKSISASSAP